MQNEYEFEVMENPTYNFTAEGNPEHNFTPSSAINITGTNDYNPLENKPSINGNVLEGDKTTEELGIPTKTSDLTNDAGFLTISDLPIYDGGVQ